MIRKNTPLIIMITFLVALCAVLACILFFHVIGNKNRHASSATHALYSRIEYLKSKDFYEAKNKELRSIEDSLDTYLLDPDHVDHVTNYLQLLASESQTSLSVTSIDSSLNPHRVILNVSIIGGFPNIVRTLERIEHAPYQLRVTSVYFNKGVEIKKGEYWQADVSFEVLAK